MPRSIFDGTLHALFQSPPWQRLQRAIDGAEGARIEKVHAFLLSKMSAQLWGKNGSRATAYRKSIEKQSE